MLTGLAGAPEWNHKVGEIQGFKADCGRYLVAVHGRSKPLGVRPGACRLIATIR
jgi:hypothetical protein